MSEAFVLPQIQQLNTTSTIMSTFASHLIVFLIGFAIGYITKDQLTVEKKVEVHIKKQKVRGENNVLDAVVDVQVDEQVKVKKRRIRNWFKKRSISNNN